MLTPRPDLSALRRSLASIQAAPEPQRIGEAQNPISLDGAVIDRTLSGGLQRAALHELFAANEADATSARSFALALATRAASTKSIVWIAQNMTARESGAVYAAGVADLGFDPGRILLVTLRDTSSALRAACDALKCRAVSVVVAETWGQSKALGLHASRRLTLAAQQSGVTVFLVRVAAKPIPSAAETRWSVRAASSRAWPAKAPGYPAFHLSLLRHRRGPAGRSWRVEWNCHDKRFSTEPLPVAVAAVSADRPTTPAGTRPLLRLAG